ncbi:MAG: O-antigen ligase family protein [SAR324 cluster bacterium]|nr:O-antigen ligase family protein [SAR324 cluster bacterium]
MTLGLFALFVIAGISIILTGSRTSWLTYPFILFSCWLIFYSIKFRGEMNRFKPYLKVLGLVFISLPTTIVVGVFLVGLLFSNNQTSNQGITVGQGATKSITQYERFQYMGARTKGAFNLFERKEIWRDTLHLIQESPGLGLGFDGYKYWITNFKAVPESLVGSTTKGKFTFDTAHNLYLQMLASVGILGFLLMASQTCYLLSSLTKNAIVEKDSFSVSVALSILVLLIFGLTQNMAYISMIWFISFLWLGYGLTMKPFQPKVEAKLNQLLIVLAVAVMIFQVAYWTGLSNNDMAVKYPNSALAQKKQAIDFKGFYPLEQWGSQTGHWSGKRGIINYSAGSQDIVAFTLLCPPTPKPKKDPIDLTFWLNGKHPKSFSCLGNPSSEMILPIESASVQEIKFSASYTWRPISTGSGDIRSIGFGIQNFRIIKMTQLSEKAQYTGLHPQEIWGGEIGHWGQKKASFYFMSAQGKVAFKLKSADPKNKADNPTRGIVVINGVKRDEILFVDGRIIAKSYTIPENQPVILDIIASRVWSPSDYGSPDTRKLAIGIMGFTAE